MPKNYPDKYPEPTYLFYVSAHLMIVKLLAKQLYKNDKIYKENKPFNLQFKYFSNTLTYISLCLFVICVLNSGVAYASNDEIEAYGPVGVGAYASLNHCRGLVFLIYPSKVAAYTTRFYRSSFNSINAISYNSCFIRLSFNNTSIAIHAWMLPLQSTLPIYFA